jgi:two-component system sensor histidine kinase QseC
VKLLPRSLQGRLLVLVLGPTVLTWLAMAALTWFDVRHELDELLDAHLAQAAALLVAQQVHEAGEGDDDDDHGIDAPTLHRYAPKAVFQVFQEGRLVLRSANAPTQPIVSPAEGFTDGFRTVVFQGQDWRVIASRVAEHDVQVYVGDEMHARRHIQWAAMRSTLLPMLVAAPLLALVAWWAVVGGLAPLRRLGHALSERRPQALHPVQVEGAPAEMQPMLAALNDLFTRIRSLMEAERRFTADAAHELRTPIAAIRAQAQVALAETDDSLRRHALEATLEGCERATRLVQQLLTLSRLEAEAVPAGDPLDLSALVRQVVAELAPAALQKQQEIALEAAQPCPVHGDATLLAVLVRNLVDNAIRYSPARANVRVTVACQGASVRLRVDDSGPGMSEGELARLGERFYRVLGSGEGGSGLGWSIVRSIAAVQQARLGAHRSAALGGLEVWVEWAAAA